MRRHVVRMASLLTLLFAFSTHPVYADEPGYFTLSAGWAWPASGPVQDTYESGFTAAASFRTGLADNYLGGFEIGYTWYSLDTAAQEEASPGSTFSGGDMGLLSITTENDYLFGTQDTSLRPFVNLGIGYFKSFVDEATVTSGSTTQSFYTGVSDASFFGFHFGVGALINRDRFGLRLDANYQILFTGGDNLEFFPIRAGLIFYV